jgi:hypothetical protein
MKNGFMSTFHLSCCLHGALVGLALGHFGPYFWCFIPFTPSQWGAILVKPWVFDLIFHLKFLIKKYELFFLFFYCSI